MCGRFTHTYTWKELHRLLSLSLGPIAEPEPSLFDPSYNVAPTQFSPVVRRDDAGVAYTAPLRWGLIPSWADDPAIGSRLINARSEEAAAKPAFRSALRHRRCLIPVSGFYEWQTIEGSKSKQPWYFTMADETPFLFAGLWERWDKSPDGQTLETFTILTREPNALLATMHNRMPCIVPSQFAALWLDPTITDPARLAPALEPFPAAAMSKRPVSTRVNSPKCNDATLIAESSALATSEPLQSGSNTPKPASTAPPHADPQGTLF